MSKKPYFLSLIVSVYVFLVLFGVVLAQSETLDSHAIYGVTISGDSYSSYSARVPADWINYNSDHAAYTIAFHEEAVQVSSCAYGSFGDHTLILERWRLRVEIIDNSRNTVIAQQDFWGSSPQYCQFSEYFSSTVEYRSGDEPNNPDEFATWINGFRRRLTPPTPTLTPEGGPLPTLAGGAVFGASLQFDGLSSSDAQLYKDVFPASWTARSEAEAAYIVQVTYDTQNITTCTFQGADAIVAQRRVLRVEVSQVSNNRVISQSILYGSTPTCPDYPPSDQHVIGDLPHPAQFARWVSQFQRFTPPTATPTPTQSPTPTMSPTPLSIPANAPVVKVKSPSANLRSGPSTNASVIKVAHLGDSLTVIGRNAAGDWLQVVTGDQQVAWVFANLVDLGDLDVTTLPEAQP